MFCLSVTLGSPDQSLLTPCVYSKLSAPRQPLGPHVDEAFFPLRPRTHIWDSGEPGPHPWNLLCTWGAS